MCVMRKKNSKFQPVEICQLWEKAAPIILQNVIAGKLYDHQYSMMRNFNISPREISKLNQGKNQSLTALVYFMLFVVRHRERN